MVPKKNLNTGIVSSFEIAIPPLDEQRRIVSILDEAEALRQLRARADECMAEFIPALFNQMFGDPATNPKGWAKSTLVQFGAKVRYGLGQPPPITDDGVPMLRATNVKAGYIVEEGLIRVSPDNVPEGKDAFLSWTLSI